MLSLRSHVIHLAAFIQLVLPSLTNGTSPTIGTIRLWRENSTGNAGALTSLGRVQIVGPFGYWGNICGHTRLISLTEAHVICHQLGYTQARLGKLTVTTRTWHNPYDGMVRLQGGMYPNEGFVEVYCNGQWGTICSGSFTKDVANTVCRQLGYARSENTIQIINSTQQPNIFPFETVIAVPSVVVVIAAIVSIVVAVFRWKHHQRTNRTIREETAGIYEPVDLIPPRLPLRTYSITLHDCPAYFKVETTDCIAYSIGLDRTLDQADGIEEIHETADRIYESIDDDGLVAMDDMHLQVPEQTLQTHSLSATLPTSTSNTYGTVTKFADHFSV